jgi:uncharacterized RDD family membrane protein YckC/Tfp pilus assembly protein PilF
MNKAGQDRPSQTGEHLSQAHACWEADDFEGALRECEQAIQLAPGLAEAHNLRGVVLEELGRREEAITAYREASHLDPSFRDARRNLAEAEAAARLVETSSERHLERAYGHEEKGDPTNALRECDTAIQIAPNLAEAHNLRGIVLEQMGYSERAIAAYREAVRLDPKMSEASENLTEAEEESRKRLQMTPQPHKTTANEEPGSAAEPISPTPSAQIVQVTDALLSIDTPENVAFDYSVAGIGSRFLAALVDTLTIALLQIMVWLVAILVLSSVLNHMTVEDLLSGWLIAAFGLLAFALLWGYYIFFEILWNGQSLGKRWVGLRVIRSDGTPITFTESIIRNLVRLVDFLPAYYGIGVVAMFIDAQSRRLGDLAAGTLVVYDRPTVTLESLSSRPRWAASAQPPLLEGAEWPVERLTSRDIQMAEEFLNRREEFAGRDAARATVARRIVRALYKRIGMELTTPPTEQQHDEDTILRIVDLYHSQGE